MTSRTRSALRVDDEDLALANGGSVATQFSPSL